MRAEDIITAVAPSRAAAALSCMALRRLLTFAPHLACGQPLGMVERQGGVDGDFEDFVRSRYPALLRFAHVLTGDPYLAADLVQDALERTGVAWPRVTRKDAPEAYVRRAIVNGFTSHWRRRRRETLTAEVPAVAADGAVPDDAMWDVLATLPPRQRAVLVLRFYEDLSEREIATALSVAPGTVKSQASKGLAALRVALARQEKSWTR